MWKWPPHEGHPHPPIAPIHKYICSLCTFDDISVCVVCLLCVCSILWRKALRFYSKCFHPINMCKIWPSKYGWNAQRMHKAETSQNKTKNSKQQHCCCQRCWRLTFIATTLLPYELIISISESRWDQFLHIKYSAIFAVRMAYLVRTYSAKNCLEMVAIRKMSVDLGQPKSLPKWISERDAVLWMHDSDRSDRTKPVPIQYHTCSFLFLSSFSNSKNRCYLVGYSLTADESNAFLRVAHTQHAYVVGVLCCWYALKILTSQARTGRVCGWGLPNASVGSVHV